MASEPRNFNYVSFTNQAAYDSALSRSELKLKFCPTAEREGPLLLIDETTGHYTFTRVRSVADGTIFFASAEPSPDEAHVIADLKTHGFMTHPGAN